MFYDELDLFIIRSILDAHHKGKEITNWEIAKNFSVKFTGLGIKDLARKKYIDNVYCKINYKLNKYCREGYFYKTKNGENKNVYHLQRDKVDLVRKRCSDGHKIGLWTRVQQ